MGVSHEGMGRWVACSIGDPEIHPLPRSREKKGGLYGRPSSMAMARPYGAEVQPKMSLLPNVGAQSCWGAGLGTVVPVRSDRRHASIAGQSAPSRVSFHTAAPNVLVATAYT